MEVNVEYVSVGCACRPKSVSWSSNGLLAFAADKSIALAKHSEDGGPGQVVAMLHGHSDSVNCVCWMRTERAQYGLLGVEFVSGSVDKNVIVWKRNERDQFVVGQVLAGHSGPVTCIAAISISNKSSSEGVPGITALIASGSADSDLIIWERKDHNGKFTALQMISFGRGFVLGLDFLTLPGVSGEPILACGGDDSRVHLFVRQESKFVRVQSLVGHEDWVRDVQFTKEDGGDLLLASCSQDGYIRLWRITQQDDQPPASHQDGSKDCKEEDLKLTGNVFTVKDTHQYTVTLESVLIGHEDWVYSVEWQPFQLVPTPTQPLCLLSASMDKTMVLWKPDPASGVWIESVRVGEVGGNTLGLYGAVFGPSGDIILAHGYQGAFHLWKKASSATPTQTDQSIDSTTHDVVQLETELWRPLPTVSGHFGPVQDLTWEPRGGDFLISVSLDQTARLHAPWVCDGDRRSCGWHEVARPQIHGYDMQCIAMIGSLEYVSGADEKVLRVFEAPRNFVGNLKRISNVDLIDTTRELALGATVPSLGLSNKAVFNHAQSDARSSTTTKNAFGDNVPEFTALDLSEPPVENHLLQNTLWPETQKLYGHGYEIFCVDCSPNGKYIASACKASKHEHASIWIWDTASWRQVTTLTHHTLTVTQLRFSHSGLYLLAVSRDRCWSLWKHTDESIDKCLFELVAQTDKGSRTHGRIIWSCSWSHDDVYFATASRDKKVYIWSQCSPIEGAKDCGEGWKVASSPLECSHAVTAVDFAPTKTREDDYLVAIGLENGVISLHSYRASTGGWGLLVAMEAVLCHTGAVKRLKWRPKGLHICAESATAADGVQQIELTLASCSVDHCVKLFRIDY